MAKVFYIFLFFSLLVSSSTNDADNYMFEDEPFWEYKNDKIYTSTFIENRPNIDGILDDFIWIEEGDDYISDFRQQEPHNLEEPTFPTYVKIVHDHENIYIAAKLYDSCPDSIAGFLSRKDSWEESFSNRADWFNIEFDSKHDHQSAYSFAVNALGVKSDQMIYLDSEYDMEYNPVWKAEVGRIGDCENGGWLNIEIEIPFKMLNITQVENPWGMNIHRYIYRYNEYSSWVATPREVPGLASHFGHIFGLKEMSIKKAIEVKPFILSGSHNQNYLLLADDQLYPDSFIIDKTKDNHFQLGLDAKLRLSSSSALDITINPDYGQIEMDPEYINLSYYEIYLPEKRTFFNESSAIFETPINIFYSRRIGASNDSLKNNINYAIKYKGSSEFGWDYGFISALTSNQHKKQNIYFAHRLTKDIMSGNSIVGLGGTTVTENNEYFYTVSFDNISYIFSNNLIFDYQYVQSINNTKIGNGQNISLFYDSMSPFIWSIDIEIYDKNFDINKLGYNYRNNLKSIESSMGYKNVKPRLGILRRYRLDSYYQLAENFDGLKIKDAIGLVGKFYTRKYNKLFIGYYFENEHYDDNYMYDYELGINGPAFEIPSMHRSFISFDSDTKRNLFFNLRFASNVSDQNNKLFQAKLGISARLGSSYLIGANFSQSKVNSEYNFLEIAEDDEVQGLNHYIFSKIDGWDNRYSLKVEKYFRNNFSFEAYAEYLVHYIHHSDYREWNSQDQSLEETSFIVGTDQFLPLYTSGSTAPGYSIVNGEIEIEQFLNPNYYVGFYPKYSSINLNLSFKWEYSTNSDLYLVCRLTRSVNGKIFSNLNDFFAYSDSDDWVEKYVDGAIYFKVNHWFDI